jgi:hypothetical protein
MDFSKFIQFPGVLVLAGVVLLIIAVIISIVSGVKNKKGKGNISEPATMPNSMPQTPAGMDPNMNNNNMGPMPDMNQANNMMANEPMAANPMMDNPMGMPMNNEPMSGPVNEAPMVNNEQKPNLMGNDNPMGMPPFVNPEVKPMVEPVPEVTPVTPVMPEPVVEEKKEPITNPWANASTAYGGANPMDGVNLNFNNTPQEPYSEKNFTVSETPTINAMPKEETPVVPSINPMEPPKSDDVETL